MSKAYSRTHAYHRRIHCVHNNAQTPKNSDTLARDRNLMMTSLMATLGRKPSTLFAVYSQARQIDQKKSNIEMRRAKLAFSIGFIFLPTFFGDDQTVLSGVSNARRTGNIRKRLSRTENSWRNICLLFPRW